MGEIRVEPAGRRGKGYDSRCVGGGLQKARELLTKVWAGSLNSTALKVRRVSVLILMCCRCSS